VSAPAPQAGARWAVAAALLLAIAYPPLAHWANAKGSSQLAVLAGVALVLLLLIEPMARLRGWAWGLAVVLLAALVSLWHSPHALLLLAAPPVLFTGWVAWFFGRSLVGGRTPLITRIVCGLYAQAGHVPGPAELTYTRRLTGCWAGLLAMMTLANLLLGLWAVPGGVLASWAGCRRWPLPMRRPRCSPTCWATGWSAGSSLANTPCARAGSRCGPTATWSISCASWSGWGRPSGATCCVEAAPTRRARANSACASTCIHC